VEREGSTARATWTTGVGLAAFGLAGILLVVGTFLPWVAQPGVNIEESVAHPFNGGSQVHSYSGWQLEQRCGQPMDFARCSVPDKSFEGRTNVMTGGWSLLAGTIVCILAVALTLALVTRRTVVSSWLLAFAWLVSIVTVAVVAIPLSTVADHLPPAVEVAGNGAPTPGPDPVRGGLVLVVGASALALVGVAVATFGRRRHQRS
jgi:hypothetical protein